MDHDVARATARERQLVLVLFCAANLVYLAYDAVRLRPLPLALVIGRVTMELALLGSLLLLRGQRATARDPFPLLRTTCAAAVACWLLVTHGAGGTASAYFAMVPAFPLIYVAAFPQDPLGSLVVGATDLLGGLALLMLEGKGAAAELEWASVSLFLGLSGFVVGRLALSRIRRELAGEKSRREAMERLAVSEERRAAAERLAGIGQLAAGVAHEINNPLSYVRSNLNALAEETARGGESHELIQDVIVGVSRIAEIVSDLSAFARNAPDTAEECDPVNVVDEAIRLAAFRVGQGSRVVRVIDPSSGPPLFLPRRRLVQALVNLLANAADAVEQGPRAAPKIRIEVRRQADAVQFEVEDNGPGPTEAARQHMFEPFFTTKGAKGTGLGLAISRDNVERCGGTLEPGVGSEGGALFTIRIPFHGSPGAGRAPR